MIFRSKELQDKYEEELKKWKYKCYLCEKLKLGFLFKDNDFIYDIIAKEHKIFCKKHNEKIENNDIFIETSKNFYEIIFKNKEKNCSIKEHEHIHLINFRDDIEESLKQKFINCIKNNNILIYLDKKYA